MIFGVMRLMCVLLFTVSIPLLALLRFKQSKFPAWLLIMVATSMGWLLPYAYMSLRAPMINELDRAEREAAEEHRRPPSPPIQNPDGSVETSVGNPYGIGDLVPEAYHPIASLLYGPAYLACCWLAAWLLFHRGVPAERRRLWLVSIGVLLIEWTAILTDLIKPPEIFGDGVLIYGWNPFFGPQLTLPLALVTAWLLVTPRAAVPKRETGKS
jgi:hypothetical protein